ncbi:MAG: hypothetical protein ACRD9W_25765 [Terriglobia bacterium]
MVFAGGLAAAVCAELEKEKLAAKEFKTLLGRLAQDVGDPTLRQAFLYSIRQARFGNVSKKLRIEAYEIALAYLSANSGLVSARSFVVEVGRWHFGRNRSNYIATMADEQAIQNDILRRCRMMLPSCDDRPGWIG